MNKLPLAKRVQILAMLCEGSSIRSTARVADVAVGSVVSFRDVSGPDRVARYNLYPASELQGDTLPGTSSATAIDTMKSGAILVNDTCASTARTTTENRQRQPIRPAYGPV